MNHPLTVHLSSPVSSPVVLLPHAAKGEQLARSEARSGSPFLGVIQQGESACCITDQEGSPNGDRLLARLWNKIKRMDLGPAS